MKTCPSWCVECWHWNKAALAEYSEMWDLNTIQSTIIEQSPYDELVIASQGFSTCHSYHELLSLEPSCSFSKIPQCSRGLVVALRSFKLDWALCPWRDLNWITGCVITIIMSHIIVVHTALH